MTYIAYYKTNRYYHLYTPDVELNARMPAPTPCHGKSPCLIRTSRNFKGLDVPTILQHQRVKSPVCIYIYFTIIYIE